jgi:hypothetical protein
MKAKAHLTEKGLSAIREIKAVMNRGGEKNFLVHFFVGQICLRLI